MILPTSHTTVRTLRYTAVLSLKCFHNRSYCFRISKHPACTSFLFVMERTSGHSPLAQPGIAQVCS